MQRAIALIHGHSIPFFDEWHHVGFWKRTLDEMPDVQLHLYTWDNWKTMPSSGIDLYLFLDYRPNLWDLAASNYHPRALFWWDSFHHSQAISVQLAMIFDKVYVAEKIESDYMTKIIGYDNVDWLPGAYYPGLYYPEQLESTYDFGFIGQFDDTVIRKYLTRKSFIDLLSHKYRGVSTNNLRGTETNQVYNKCKIMPERTIFANIGTRLFEVVGSGGFCLINRYPCRNGLDELGIDGYHFVTYDESWVDFQNKFEYYLRNEDEREAIARQGHQYFFENHTYGHRVKKILKDFNL